MTLSSFNIILLSEQIFSFGNINVSDLTFGGHPLQPLPGSMLFPGAPIQAAAGPFVLNIVGPRVEATVVRPGDVGEDCRHLVATVEQLFDYVGRRTIKAVGHNATQEIPGAADRQLIDVLAPLLNLDACANAIGGAPTNAELSLFFNMSGGEPGRVAFVANEGGALVLDFNAHFELDGRDVGEVVSGIGNSLEHFNQIVDSVVNTLDPAS